MNAVTNPDPAAPFAKALANMAAAAAVVDDAQAMLAEPWARLSWEVARRPPRSDEIAFVLEHLPSSDSTAARLATLATGEQPATAAQVRQAIGALIDGYPNASPHAPVAYVETLVFEAARVKPGVAAITGACATLRRSTRFAPSAAELLEALESATNWLKAARSCLERTATQRVALAAALPSPPATSPPADARAHSVAGLPGDHA